MLISRANSTVSFLSPGRKGGAAAHPRVAHQFFGPPGKFSLSFRFFSFELSSRVWANLVTVHDSFLSYAGFSHSRRKYQEKNWPPDDERWLLEERRSWRVMDRSPLAFFTGRPNSIPRKTIPKQQVGDSASVRVQSSHNVSISLFVCLCVSVCGNLCSGRVFYACFPYLFPLIWHLAR